jgi:hypothetical protein
MSCHDKQVILETHNRLRQMLALGQIRGQPPSLDMRELVGSPLIVLFIYLFYTFGMNQNCLEKYVSKKSFVDCCFYCICWNQVWDEELAAIAQRWADQCNAGHDRLRRTGIG